jgi:putative flippase GtrA
MSSERDELISASRYDVAPHLSGSMLRYVVVGVGTALFEVGVFQFLLSATGHSVPLSNPIAVICATALNFALNRSWSFGSGGSVARSGFLYLLLFLFNMSVSTLVIDRLSLVGVTPISAKVLTMCCIAVWNFVIYRTVVFR